MCPVVLRATVTHQAVPAVLRDPAGLPGLLAGRRPLTVPMVPMDLPLRPAQQAPMPRLVQLGRMAQRAHMVQQIRQALSVQRPRVDLVVHVVPAIQRVPLGQLFPTVRTVRLADK
jgi:hypothetical protein